VRGFLLGGDSALVIACNRASRANLTGEAGAQDRLPKASKEPMIDAVPVRRR
jgi:hypothetical protein